MRRSRGWGGRRRPATRRASWCTPDASRRRAPSCRPGASASARRAGAELPPGGTGRRPPAYSAIKIGGRRAYALARAGEAVEVPERDVEVREFRELWREGDRAAYAIACSSGTYVRSLIADLPGGDAYCVELRRTAIGPFGVDEA